MGQENKIIAIIKKIYKKFVSSEKINIFLKKYLNKIISFWALKKGFHFPSKFTWDWKIDMLLENYEKNTVKFFKKSIKHGMTVLDIGAHIGYYTMIFSKLVGPKGKVYAFEPDLDNFLLLKENTKSFNNVEVFRTAISDKEGKIDFYKIEDNTGCHSIVLPSLKSEKITVDSSTLDAFLESKKIKNVDFIKIDIEGGEPLAFRGMQKLISSSKTISIVSEFNPEAILQGREDPKALLETFKNSGLKIYEIKEGGIRSEIKDIDKISFYTAKEKYTNILCQK